MTADESKSPLPVLRPPAASVRTNATIRRLHGGGTTVEIVCDSDDLLPRFGPRFDRTAYVRQITLHNHRYLAPAGLSDEFGLLGTGVLGFDEAAADETFIKIGVGRLVRGTVPKYFFAEPYPIAERFPVLVRATDRSITVTQETASRGRWAYSYQKCYTVDKAGALNVRYTLANTGTAAFTFEHYNHHWFSFADCEIGPDVSLHPGFSVPAEIPSGWALSNGALHPSRNVTGRTGIAWRWSRPTGPAALTVHQRQTGQGVEIRADFPLSRFAVWANEEAFCPELFHEASLAPRERCCWSLTYRFGASTLGHLS